MARAAVKRTSVWPLIIHYTNALQTDTYSYAGHGGNSVEELARKVSTSLVDYLSDNRPKISVPISVFSMEKSQLFASFSTFEGGKEMK